MDAKKLRELVESTLRCGATLERSVRVKAFEVGVQESGVTKQVGTLPFSLWADSLRGIDRRINAITDEILDGLIAKNVDSICAGLSDPAGEIAAMRQSHEWLRKIIAGCVASYETLNGHDFYMDGQEAFEEATAALSILPAPPSEAKGT